MPVPSRQPSTHRSVPRRVSAHFHWTFPSLILCASLALFALPAALPAAAMVPAATQPSPHPQHPRHSRRTAKKQPAAPVPPPAPPLPNWPANEQPKPAAVTWDSRGLSIVASNSSLADILHQVSIATGVQVQGFSTDQRIFGSYGPAPAREVLAQLLAGSGYNVLIFGGLGSQPPTQLVLSPRPTGTAPPASPMQQSSYDNADSYDQPAPPQQGPEFQPSPQVRTPQQTMEEMERRRQMLLQQNQTHPEQQQPQDPNEPQL
ncbi:MAG TPA: hypothetical protein VFU68_00965 [Terracidiphilus sp.]|nr:hypothetical protein [Terracidiphilus sp.]